MYLTRRLLPNTRHYTEDTNTLNTCVVNINNEDQAPQSLQRYSEVAKDALIELERWLNNERMS